MVAVAEKLVSEMVGNETGPFDEKVRAVRCQSLRRRPLNGRLTRPPRCPREREPGLIGRGGAEGMNVAQVDIGAGRDVVIDGSTGRCRPGLLPSTFFE